MIDEICYLVFYIMLMMKMGIFEEIRMKNRDVKINVDFLIGIIIFKGFKDDIMRIRFRLVEEVFKKWFKNWIIFDVLLKN